MDSAKDAEATTQTVAGEIRYVQFERKHIPGILLLTLREFPLPENIMAIKAIAMACMFGVVALDENDKVAGYFLGQSSSSKVGLSGKKLGNLTIVCVSSNHQKKGISKNMGKYIMEGKHPEFKLEDYDEILIQDTDAWNSPSWLFSDRNGFRYSPTHDLIRRFGLVGYIQLLFSMTHVLPAQFMKRYAKTPEEHKEADALERQKGILACLISGIMPSVYWILYWVMTCDSGINNRFVGWVFLTVYLLLATRFGLAHLLAPERVVFREYDNWWTPFSFLWPIATFVGVPLLGWTGGFYIGIPGINYLHDKYKAALAKIYLPINLFTLLLFILHQFARIWFPSLLTRWAGGFLDVLGYAAFFCSITDLAMPIVAFPSGAMAIRRWNFLLFVVIDHHSSAAVPTRKVKNVIAVWHWGYAVGRPISLQSVFSPPTTTAQTHLFQRNNEDDANKSTSNSSSKNYTSYCDPDTLCIADGLLFIGGSSTIRGSSTNNKNVNSRNQEKKRVPCVWFGKIYPREKWSCIPIIFSNNHGVRNNDKPFNTVTALSVTTYTSRKLKYLAVATKDGSVSVWTYDLAVSTNRLNKDSIDYTYYVDFQKAREELIQPFCKLQGSSSFHNVTGSIFRSSSHLNNNQSDDDDDDASKVVADESLKNMIDNNRYCSDLEWISPGSSVSLSLLAAGFTDGVAVYHVSLPIISNFVSTSSDIVRNVEENGGFITKHQNSVPLLSPIAIVKADVSSLTKNNKDLTGGSTVASNYLPKNSVLTWLDLGPTHPPCIAVLFRSALISEDTILPEISVSC